jgi:hypothetical protein
MSWIMADIPGFSWILLLLARDLLCQILAHNMKVHGIVICSYCIITGKVDTLTYMPFLLSDDSMSQI